ncbi:MAG: glutamate-5-semialdehyde dehydrogenase [Butyrivibrio sp.]|nr:glutamate-5-semialdehyde dehydrogenase [Butyrivibrio sp.]
MSEVRRLCENAKAASYVAAGLSTEEKNAALRKAADALEAAAAEILPANEEDVRLARENGMHPGMVDRLLLTPERITKIANGIRQVAELPDPVGIVEEDFTRPNGMRIRKVRVPFGVIGIIYESRPEVTADAFSLTFKTGNAVVLKGGSDAIHSNTAITQVLRHSLEASGITPDVMNLVTSTERSAVDELLTQRGLVDVVIPRGGAGLIRHVVDHAQVPVIETGSGNCHIYVDESADLDKAGPIIVNAKTQRIGVCNAAESLLVHENIREALLPRLQQALNEVHPVELRADDAAIGFLSDAVPATEADYGKEYLDYILSIKTVGSVEEAIAHINRYNTGHSESIITEDPAHAEAFLKGVDAACVYVNASTRFTDGGEFGFGAEIGISTQKLHARGPMGLRELTSYKYEITGNGQVRP